MSIKFACHHCGQRLSVSDAKVGKKAKCPKCKGAIAVPTQEAGAAQLAEIRAARDDVEVEDAFAEFTVYDDEGSELIYETEDDQPAAVDGAADATLVAVPRWVLYAQGILLGIVALVAFTLGILVGGVTTSGSGDGDEEFEPVTVSGKVTYVDSANEQAPDEGAVVMAVPSNAKPEEKIETEGLRSGDEASWQDHPGILAVRQLGGDVARVNIDGNYRLRLAGPDAYYVLIISRHARVPEGVTPNLEHLAKMGGYFKSSLELIDPQKYLWTNKRVSKDTNVDHDFGRTRE
jgi:hypothetical protein